MNSRERILSPSGVRNASEKGPQQVGGKNTVINNMPDGHNRQVRTYDIIGG